LGLSRGYANVRVFLSFKAGIHKSARDTETQIFH